MIKVLLMKCFKNVAFDLSFPFILKKLQFYNRNFGLIIKMKLCFVETDKKSLLKGNGIT
jgi:hypothetical protein